MARFDPPAVRARLAVPLDNIEPGMVVQVSTRYLVIHEIGERVGKFSDMRRAVVSHAGGANTTDTFPINLHDLRDGYQTRPHFAQLKPGDVIMSNRKRITVRSVQSRTFGVTKNVSMYSKTATWLTVEGTYVQPGRNGALPRTFSTTIGGDPLDQVRVVSWGS